MSTFRSDPTLSDIVSKASGNNIPSDTMSNSSLKSIVQAESAARKTNLRPNPFGVFKAHDNRQDTAFDSFKKELIRSIAPFLPIPGEVGERFQLDAEQAAPGTGISSFAGGVTGSILPSALAILAPPTAPVVAASFFGRAATQDLEDTDGEDLSQTQRIASAVGAGAIESAMEMLGVKVVGKIGVKASGTLGKAIMSKDVAKASKIMSSIMLDMGVEGGEEGGTVVLDAFNKVALGIITPDQAMARIKDGLPSAVLGGVLGGAVLAPVSLASPSARMNFKKSIGERQDLSGQIAALSSDERAQMLVEVETIIADSQSGDGSGVTLNEDQIATAEFIRSVIADDSNATTEGTEEARKVFSEGRSEISEVHTDDGLGPSRLNLQIDSQTGAIFGDNVKTIQQKAREIVLSEHQELQSQISEQREFARQAVRSVKASERVRARENVQLIRQKAKANKANIDQLNKDLRTQINNSGLPKNIKNQLLASTASNVKTPAALESRISAVEKAQAQFNLKEAQSSLNKTLSRASKVKTADVKTKALLDSFTSQFDKSKPTGKTISRLTGLSEFMDRNPDVLIPQKAIDRLKRLDKKPVADLTEQEARDADEVISQIVHEIDRKTKLITGRGEIEFEKTVVAIEAEISANTTRRKELPSGKLKKEPQDSAAKLVFGLEEGSSIDTMSEFLGGSPVSKTHDVLFGNIDQDNKDKYNTYYKFKDMWESKIKGTGLELGSKRMKLMSDALASASLFRSAVNRERISKAVTHKITLTNGQEVKMFKAQAMMLAATLQDTQTRDLVLFKGAPIVPQGQSSSNAFKMSVEDIDVINQSLSTEERQITKSFVEILNGPLADVYREYSLRQFGFDKTKDGTWVPRRRVKDGTKVQPITAQNAVNLSIENLAINKDRTEDSRSPIEIGDIFVEFENLIWTVSSLRHLSPSIDSARRVLADERISKVIRESTRGSRAIDRFTSQYDNVVKSFVGRGLQPRVSIDSVSRRIILNVNKALLSFSPTVPFYQPISVINASFEIPKRFLARALAEGSLANLSIDQRMNESGAVRFRSEGSIYSKVSAGTGAQSRRILGNKEKGESGLALIRVMDQAAIRTIWRASELQAASDLKAGLITQQDVAQRTEDIAQRVINRTQPTGDPLYSTGVVAQRSDSALAAGLGAFRAQTSKNMDMIIREWVRAKRRPFGRFRAVANTATLVFGTAVSVSAIEDAINFALNGFELPEDNNRTYLESLFKDTLKRAAGIPLFGSYLFGVFRGFISAASGLSDNKDPFEGERVFSPSFSPAASTASDIVTKTARLGESIKDDGEAAAILDITSDVAAALLSLKGIPLVVPLREAKKIHKNLSDDNKRSSVFVE